MDAILFYVAAAVSVLASLFMIVCLNAVHGLLYLIVSLLATGIVFYLLGAHFAAVLEVIVYAGGIMVLFVFVIMMLNLGQESVRQEKLWLSPAIWRGPGALSMLLLLELVLLLGHAEAGRAGQVVDSKQVGIALFGPYLLVVELASMLLLAGLVGAYHMASLFKKGGWEG